MNNNNPVREAFKQIDTDSWLIGTKFILKKTLAATNSGHLWTSQDGFSYSICDAPHPTPLASPLPSDSPFRKVHDAGDATAVWDLGGACLKIKLILDTQGTTEEHTTLNWLANQKLSFDVPKALYHAREDDRLYLITSRVPGETISQLWRGLDDGERYRYAKRVVEIAQELSQWQSNKITGVDGRPIAESWLNPTRIKLRDMHPLSPRDYSPETLQRNCEGLGMDCTRFYFSHNNLGPDDLLVDRNRDTIGLIDWETAGYVPREWPRTYAAVSWAADLDFTAKDYPDEAELEEKWKEWRLLLAKTLGEAGFPEVTEAYRSFIYKR